MAIYNHDKHVSCLTVGSVFKKIMLHALLYIQKLKQVKETKNISA